MSLIKLAPKSPLEEDKYVYTESLNNMSTKTWQEELEDISSDIDDEDLPNWYPVISFPDALKFITDIRKNDEAELIKMIYEELQPFDKLKDLEKSIKQYYANN